MFDVIKIKLNIPQYTNFNSNKDKDNSIFCKNTMPKKKISNIAIQKSLLSSQ